MTKRPIDMTPEELFAAGRSATPTQAAVLRGRIREDVQGRLEKHADKLREDLTHAVGEKSPEMEDALQRMFGMNRKEHAFNMTCVGCTGPATEFDDELSKREYKITLLCQKCQDAIDETAEVGEDGEY